MDSVANHLITSSLHHTLAIGPHHLAIIILMSDSSAATMRSSRFYDDTSISRLLRRHRRRTKRLLKRHSKQLQQTTRNAVAEEVQRAIAPLLYAPVVRGDDQGAQDEREELHRDVQYAIRGGSSGSGGGGLSSGNDWPAAKGNDDLDSMEDMDLIVEVMTIRTRMRKARDVIRARRRQHEARTTAAAASGAQPRQGTTTATSASQSQASTVKGISLGDSDSRGPCYFGGRAHSSTNTPSSDAATAPARTVPAPQLQSPPQLPGINSLVHNYFSSSTTAPEQDRSLAPPRESVAHACHPRGNEATPMTSSTTCPQQGVTTATTATTLRDEYRPRFAGTAFLDYLRPSDILSWESTRSAGEGTSTSGIQESQSGGAI